MNYSWKSKHILNTLSVTQWSREFYFVVYDNLTGDLCTVQCCGGKDGWWEVVDILE